MERIINPCECEVYTCNGKMRLANAFVKIIYNDGKLSFSGVIGPKRNGYCTGSCGQCVDEIRKGIPKEPWTSEMLASLCDIWDEWHLNDLRPYCRHQKELGWGERAGEKITLYHYKLNDESAKKRKEAENAAFEALKLGITFTPTEAQTMYATMVYFLDTYDKIEEDSELAKYYMPYRSASGRPTAEITTRGWVDYAKHDKGILGKPCPICGYKYGTKWIKEDVPKEIIDWLFNLPKTTIDPA